MTREELKNKIAFQVNFILYSGKSPMDAVEDMTKIADDYANARELSVRKELDFMGENEDTYEELEDDNLTYIDCPHCGIELDAIDIEYRRCHICQCDIDEDAKGGEG